VAEHLSKDHYQAIHKFLEDKAGIRLGAGKEYLVSSRLGRLLGDQGLTDYAQLVEKLGSFSGRSVQAAVIDAMTTNETFWFRDASHFKILTEECLANHKGGNFRVWSAASSSGQEAYNISMVLVDARRGGRGSQAGRIEVIGTDISPSVLAQASSARYCGISAGRGLNEQQRKRYFKADGDCIEVLPDYRSGVSFREFNLTKPFDALGRFDVIFCRNVLIYFSADLKRQIIERMARALNPGGFLFLGSTESLNGHQEMFEMVSIHGGLGYRRR